MKISELIKKEFPYLQTDETLASAASKMAENRISEVPVLHGWKFMGIVRLSDISGAIVRDGLFSKPSLRNTKKIQNQKISRYVRNGRIWLKPDADIASLLLFIKQRQNTEVVPVVDAQMRLMGVIYIQDVLESVMKIMMEGSEDKGMLSSLLQGPERIEGQTPIDQLVHLIDKKGSIGMNEAAKICGLSHSEIQDYAKSLEKNNLIRIEYGLFGTRLFKPEKPRQRG